MSKRQYIRLFLLLSAIVFSLGLTQLIYFKVMSSVKTGTIGKINGIANGEVDAELTVWGASTALLNFNPAIISDSLKLTTLNFGINGTNIDQYNGLLKQYISTTRKSKYILVALDVFGGLEKREKFYQLHNWLHHIYNDNIYESLSDIDPPTMYKARYIPFYAITLFDKHGFSYFRNAVKSQDEKYDLAYSESNSLSYQNNLNKVDKLSIEYDLSVYNKLRSSCLLAQTRNIKPIIVITPCFYKGLEKITNSEAFIEQLQLLQKDNIPVFNYLDCDISHDQDNFKDNTHLNSKGADIFSRQLSNDLKKLFERTQ